MKHARILLSVEFDRIQKLLLKHPDMRERDRAYWVQSMDEVRVALLVLNEHKKDCT